MHDYSLELKSRDINDSRTQQYFEEVIGAYTSGYYRSCVVMLWSVVVTDIMFKLDHLATGNIDPKAVKILAEIEAVRNANKASPQWELKLIELVEERTEFLDVAEFTNLQQLQQHRHLSAHPVITNNNALFTPSKDQARAHIRNALDAVLTKSPLMSAEVFGGFLESIEEFSKISPSQEQLSSFITSKYIEALPAASLDRIYRSLWRICFKSTDERCIRNSELNTNALRVIHDSDRSRFRKLVADDADYFSDISADAGRLKVLISFLNFDQGLYQDIKESTKALIDSYAQQNTSCFAECWFTNEPQQFFDSLAEKMKEDADISKEAYGILVEAFADDEFSNKIYDLGIDQYIKSPSFDEADQRFDVYIKPFYWSYSEEQFLRLLQGIEGSGYGYNQCMDRKGAWADHNLLLKRVVENRSPDVAQIEKFVRSVDSSLLPPPPLPSSTSSATPPPPDSME